MEYLNSSIDKSRICAVVPVYNEIDFIDEVIHKITPHVSKIICIDDGSSDGTRELLDAKTTIELEAEVILISNSKNFGKGFSLRVGLQKALEFDFDFVVTLDGDMQHIPELIPKFINLLNDFDLVIGNRLHTLKGMPLQRIASNKLTSWLLSKKVGIKILDSQSGFRAFRKEVIKNILPVETGFEAETEMIVRAALHNYKIGFVDVPTIYNSSISKMKPMQAIVGFLKVLLNKY